MNGKDNQMREDCDLGSELTFAAEKFDASR